MFSISGDLCDAVYSFKDYANEAEKNRHLINAHRPGTPVFNANLIREVCSAAGYSSLDPSLKMGVFGEEDQA
jgi:hypothetical protein